MKKQRVGIVFGGKSSEHEVSLQSAKNIVDAIDKTRFEVVLLGIDKQGQWHLNDASSFLLNAENPSLIALNRTAKQIALIPGEPEQPLIARDDAHSLSQLDVIFPVVHGTQGEDGALQGLLRMASLPFVGSDVLGSAVSMDKDFTKRLLRDAGLQVAPWLSVTSSQLNQLDTEAVIARFGLPLFVKPANQGSSVGVSKVTHAAALLPALEMAFTFDRKALIEKAIKGREIECAVLGNEEPQASPCGEVVVKEGFYSYDTKYISETGAQTVIPAAIPPDVDAAIRQVAIKAFTTLECFGMARVDVFYTEEGEIVINEVNTLPGFTNISMYPKLWQAAGLSYQDLITRLIELTIARHQQSALLKTSIH
ncbi:D-alanine--D-alanine ligase [Pantoea stewartii]|uniref:D-alanine--D-alanine ligase n=1 Tax=Pantoea stewartii subsp. stewartii DC283 TaxID=660596 RepID=A0ABN4ZDX3_PANSE|nr:D-alanine--D-alanine ligase [Pantoea stewartii]ARF52016.1 D-alanine--D-alanine ligase A [Pantoea stewartii subsp. stewartii DC283]KAB0559800.1 D-alanine--D-alanine ligase [Pantoea stewartii subsp. stewartii]